MFVSNLFRDETELRQFMDSLLEFLRDGRAHDAAAHVDFALGVLEEFNHPIAAMCRANPFEKISLKGWDQIADRLTQLDKPHQPITAISIDISCHGENASDAEDAPAPFLETNFFSDAAFPFSTSGREALCNGYDGSSALWVGNFEDIDCTIEASGIGALSFAIDALERDNRGGDDPIGTDAMYIGLAYRAVAIHQAVRLMVEKHGLSRPLTILVGSNESYPFFDAPAITSQEYRELFPESGVVEEALSDTGDDYQAVEMPEEPDPVAEPEPAKVFEAPASANAYGHVSGSEIRRRFADPAVQDEAAGAAGGLFSRLFKRR